MPEHPNVAATLSDDLVWHAPGTDQYGGDSVGRMRASRGWGGSRRMV